MELETATVSPDEPCYGLREESRVVPGLPGRRWIQVVRVVRGNAIATHTTDFGPAEDYATVTPLLMPSFGENTVAQLREHAEKNRHDDYWHQRAQAQLAESTLIRDHIEQIEMAKTYAKRNHRTVKELK